MVATHEITPILAHTNIYTTLPEACDKINFTQNMQGMIKGEHKRKLTKEEKRMTRQINFSHLAENAVPPLHKRKLTKEEKRMARQINFSHLVDNAVPPLAHDERPQTFRTLNKSAHNYQRLNTSPITIPGTPDTRPQPPPRQSRCFPVPNYSHRDTNYKPPPLCDRMLIDDYYAGRDLFPHEWAKQSRQKVPSQAKILTEDDFDFSDAGFASELFRVGGQYMKRDYETRASSAESDDSDSSKNSLRIYQKASACYKPEQGESNAEAAERHRLIDNLRNATQQHTLAKILHILQIISPDHELWDYATPTAYVFVNSRTHGLALPPWPESKTEDNYFLGFQKWADNIDKPTKN